MHILAIYAHPSPKSFNRALLDLLVDEAAAKGHECAVRDLYAENFRNVLSEEDFHAFSRGKTPDDIKDMQDAVARADIVTFIHPIWWSGCPAILKGWVERVFSYGFAYSHDSRGIKPLLAGKKAIIINTAGGAESEGTDGNSFKEAFIKLYDQAIYMFVGFDVILHRMFFQISTASDEERRDLLEQLRADLRKIL
ncbi:MAG: NAD(P)H-dependent oxidoreductase [Planctomycetes bacterium]|nr:NAD(P)H-dependent oxidoreductase [Planctomycetota bacterium]